MMPPGAVTLEPPERPRTEDVRIMRWPLRGTWRDTPPEIRRGIPENSIWRNVSFCFFIEIDCPTFSSIVDR